MFDTLSFSILLIVPTVSKSKTTPPAKESPPKYQNVKLEKIITENKANSELYLCGKNLTDQDIEIVVYYALQNNKVSNTVSI